MRSFGHVFLGTHRFSKAKIMMISLMVLGLSTATLVDVASIPSIHVDRDGTIWRGRVPYSNWDEIDVLDHTGEHKCGTKSGVLHDAAPSGRRQLVQSDCTASFTNPAAEYKPTAGPVYQVKVVVHVVTNGATGSLSDSCVQSGITWLNNDFRAVSGTKGGNGVDTRIQFVLATTDANGASTTGIVRHDNEAWFNQESGYSTLWDQAWDNTKYLNVFTKNTGTSLGWATLAANAGANTDGVTVSYRAYGNCATNTQYNQGATLTHEVGHYLGLEHPFTNTVAGTCDTASTPGCYYSGDLICGIPPPLDVAPIALAPLLPTSFGIPPPADTNPQSAAIYDCVDANLCGNTNNINNYMDYSDDSCLTKFTIEQAFRSPASQAQPRCRPCPCCPRKSGWPTMRPGWCRRSSACDALSPPGGPTSSPRSNLPRRQLLGLRCPLHRHRSRRRRYRALVHAVGMSQQTMGRRSTPWDVTTQATSSLRITA